MPVELALVELALVELAPVELPVELLKEVELAPAERPNGVKLAPVAHLREPALDVISVTLA